MADKGLGLKKETSAALSYVLGPISGFVFLILDRDPFVRFHAMQSIVVLGILFLLGVFLPFIPFVGSLVWVLYFVVMLVGAYQASQGNKWEVPVLGPVVRSLLKS